MVRRIVKIAVFLVVANGVYQVAPVAYRQLKFSDALGELVLYGQKLTDAEIVNRALALAADNNVPLDREYVRVRHEVGAIHLDASYVEPMHLLPGYTYLRQIDIDAKAVDLSAAPPPR